MAYQYHPPSGQPPYSFPSSQPPYAAGEYPPPGAPPSAYPPNSYQQPPRSYAPQGPPPQGYAQYSYQQPSQGYPPPQGLPPQGYPPPQYPPQQGYAAVPPTQIYNAPQGYPTSPSLGYGPPQQIPYNPDPDADALRKAMKGFGTDEKTLIAVLADKDPLQVNLIRQSYTYRHKRNLENDIKSETSRYFEEGLCALVRGPLLQDCYVLHRAMKGLGTKESDLNDVLLSRSNADMRAIKETYQRTYGRPLESDLKGDLSMKTERHFMMVVAANRVEASIQPHPQQVDHDVLELYKATEGRAGTDELLVCSILTERNDAQIGAIAYAYEQRFRKSLESVIRSEFSGHMQSALLHQLRGGVDRAGRDAILLEDAMAGMGTEDHKLVNRVIRCHWDRNYLAQVKDAYRHKFRQELAQRIRGETSGDYQRLMLACIGER